MKWNATDTKLQARVTALCQHVSSLLLTIIMSTAKVPFVGDDHSDYEIIDSLEVNGRYYKDVFKLKTDYYNNVDELIHAETILYNYENGFVGIVMSNGEKYMLYED